LLDEGTANLDDYVESLIVDAIKALPITRIVVAHRSALIDAADRVFSVADGSVHDGRMHVVVKTHRRPIRR